MFRMGSVPNLFRETKDSHLERIRLNQKSPGVLLRFTGLIFTKSDSIPTKPQRTFASQCVTSVSTSQVKKRDWVHGRRPTVIEVIRSDGPGRTG